MHIIEIAALILAIVLRGIDSINKHQKKHKEDFKFSYYFDFKHCFRWIIHILSSILGYLSLPNLLLLISIYFEVSYDRLISLMVLGAGIIGYLGYDIIKLLETISLWIFDKLGIPLRNKVTKK